jgi:hypothetical protein
MMKLSRDDTIAAIRDGVHRAFYEALTSGGQFDVPHELICEAVRQGTRDAILRVATQEADGSCGRFYAAIQNGTAEDFAKLQENNQ